MKSKFFLIFALLLFPGVVVAQPAPAPAPAAAEQAVEEASDENTRAVLAFFEGLVQLAQDNKGDCAQMGAALNEHLNANEAMLRDAAYSPSAAPAEEEVALLNAATTLGDLAGQCYQEQSVIDFFERLVKLTEQLDQSGS